MSPQKCLVASQNFRSLVKRSESGSCGPPRSPGRSEFRLAAISACQATAEDAASCWRAGAPKTRGRARGRAKGRCENPPCGTWFCPSVLGSLPNRSGSLAAFREGSKNIPRLLGTPGLSFPAQTSVLVDLPLCCGFGVFFPGAEGFFCFTGAGPLVP